MWYWVNRGARPKTCSTPVVPHPGLWTDIVPSKRRARSNKNRTTHASPKVWNRYVVRDELPVSEPNAIGNISAVSSDANADTHAAGAHDTAELVRSVFQRHAGVNNRPKTAKANVTSSKTTGSEQNVPRATAREANHVREDI